MLGNWPADRFEAAWDSYMVRKTLDEIESQRHDMTMALYANGMIGGDALTRELNSINENAEQLRRRVLGADLVVEELEFDLEPPMPRNQSG